MNTFILAFHPRGVSLVEHLTRAGHEVWTANLRGQGESKNVNGRERIGFADLSLSDFPKVLDYVLEHAKGGHQKLIAIGCSLGGSVLYTYLAHNAAHHRLHGMVGMGAPLRWEGAHPLVRAAFSSPWLAGVLPISGTRAMARRLLPTLKRVPKVLSIYMNVDHIDLSQVDVLTQTVDDPNRLMNKQIAHWVKSKDLVVRGVNVSEALTSVDLPLLSIFANSDGIVPGAAARSVQGAMGSSDLSLLEVGDAAVPFAHADMFINDHAQAQVFEPMTDWLSARFG